jgi:hypothetical protein
MEMAVEAILPLLFGPAPITIHDDGDVTRQFFHIDVFPG